ncbi:M24 family metallopeptidase [Marivirga atlantica]|jgi:Xaa-Pro aminopeptidase|uniref:Aminopeptidase P family protein n=1 Tax=Marivirga atlantica TaxID=1548457 RepID=A0A937DL13_9BACT|nr:M24 family metallopeptidase [Marivirga atlantica]MBL0766624.1 aminopeptidase P family protein [Marivirga atlantica]
MRKFFQGLTCLFFTISFCSAQYAEILPLRERANLEDKILKQRFETVLPNLMERTSIDTWVIISREYNEDPVIKTMLPSTWMSARRRTILVMHHSEGEGAVEGYAVARYKVGDFFEKSWNPELQPDQWKALFNLLEDLNPKQIGLNYSDDYGHADGINKTEYELFMSNAPKSLKDKVVSAEPLAVGWLETRSATEIIIYEQLCRIAHQIIAKGFSLEAITPGVSTTEDLVWWYRQEINDLGLDTWFHPTVDIQRADPESFDHLRSFSKRPDQQTIIPGDLLHVDFGITYLGLNTDTQEHAYVLKPEEKEIPVYLKKAFEQGKAVQDHLTNQFKTGRTGNEMLANALEDAKAAGLKPTIYTHPIGLHGHAAGPTIGMWDQQGGVPGSGDYPLYPNTAYSIELNAAVYLEEWKKEIRIMLEQEAFFTGDSIYYIDGRQEAIHAIPRSR